MKVGFVGLGKLGLICAEEMWVGNHEVTGYDINEALMTKNTSKKMTSKV